jgi:AmmeMemoRadiSam system protein B
VRHLPLVALLLFAAACGGRQAATELPPAVESHPALFHDEARFSAGAQAAELVPAPEGEVAGGIIPHHLLAGAMINGFFRGLALEDPPATIVLIGPNHDNEGSARVLTSDLAWSTPFGDVEAGQAWVRALTESGLAQIDRQVLTTEHSVAGIMPAIKYELPDARVVPIILSGDLSPAEAQRLGEVLASRADENTVIVAAVDFSHYLEPPEAQRRDVVTLAALRSFDAPTLFTLDSGYLDSAASIAVLIAAMAGQGADRFVLLDNTNSGALENDELLPTTSYVSGYYPAAAPR